MTVMEPDAYAKFLIGGGQLGAHYTGDLCNHHPLKRKRPNLTY